MRASIKWKFCLRRREGISVRSAEIFLRDPTVSQLSQLLTFLPKNGSLFLSKSISPQNLISSYKMEAVPAATKNPNFWKNGSDIAKSAAVPKITNIGKFWKRATKKRKRFPLPSIFAHFPVSNSASIFCFFIFLAFSFSFLIWASLAIFFSLAILAFSAFSCLSFNFKAYSSAIW